MRILIGGVVACVFFATSAWAQSDSPQNPNTSPPADAGQTAPSAHPAAVTYSNGYQVRAKIHKVASFATLPLFGAEFALGQSMYNNSTNSDTRRGLHGAIGTGIVSLFAVNSVTGVWNMIEDRKNPTEHHTRRLIHGILMLTANAGFLATAATGPHESHRGILTGVSSSNKALHRDLAIGSIGVGSVGYTLMLFGKK